MYRLHGFCQSGNTYKVALMLQVLGEPWSAVFVDFLGGVTRKPQWRADVNEMGEAPVLEDGSLRLTQSGVILSYLARKHARFGGRDEAEGREILRWILFDNHKFTSYFATYRFLKAFAPAAPDPAVMAFLKTRIDAAYAIADGHLAVRAFMLGEAPTIADFSLGGYAFFPEDESGLQLMERFANVARWRDRLRALPGWADPYAILPGERIKPRA
jgi:glutathione S-transferase